MWFNKYLIFHQTMKLLSIIFLLNFLSEKYRLHVFPISTHLFD